VWWNVEPLERNQRDSAYNNLLLLRVLASSFSTTVRG
jgi:hypothetical protein